MRQFSHLLRLTAGAVTLAITRPMKYDQERVLRRMPFVFIMVWISGFIFLIPEAATSYPINSMECVLYYELSFTEMVIINSFYAVVMPTTPLIIMVYTYGKIAISLSQGSKTDLTTSGKGRVSLHKAQVHVIQTAAGLSALFLACYTYLYVFQIGSTFFNVPWYPQYHIAVALIIINSCINPYVYCIRYDEFQKRLGEIWYNLKKCCCGAGQKQSE